MDKKRYDELMDAWFEGVTRDLERDFFISEVEWRVQSKPKSLTVGQRLLRLIGMKRG